MKLFTFYTKNTPYEQEAILTVEAFASFGIPCEAIPYENKNDWMKNALARSELLEELAAKYPGSLGMIDADCRPIKNPVRIVYFNGDFACEDRGVDKRPTVRYSAGVTLFGSSPAGRQLLAEWRKRCSLDPCPKAPLREQLYLFHVIEAARKNPDFHFVDLGNEYNRKSEDVRPGDDTVMIHDVASRRYLKKIGGRR